MISLSEYIEEGLLSGYDKIGGSTNPKKEIREFIKANYKTKGRLQISKEPNENGKYEVSCTDVTVTNTSITSLAHPLFEWENIDKDFIALSSLTSLEGAPKKVGGRFGCYACSFLTSLEGAPKEVGGDFDCSYCSSLTSLEGAPKEVGGSFHCSNCKSLTSLKGAPEKVGEYFNCVCCNSLTSLEGTPKKVGEGFRCAYCKSLTSLKGAPKEVGGEFDCMDCGREFTEDDVKKVCKVGRDINC